jgi:hypothetical protein
VTTYTTTPPNYTSEWPVGNATTLPGPKEGNYGSTMKNGSASLQKIVVAIVVLTSFVASIFVVVACLLYFIYRYLYNHSEDEKSLGFHLRPYKDMVSLEKSIWRKIV